MIVVFKIQRGSDELRTVVELDSRCDIIDIRDAYEQWLFSQDEFWEHNHTNRGWEIIK